MDLTIYLASTHFKQGGSYYSQTLRSQTFKFEFWSSGSEKKIQVQCGLWSPIGPRKRPDVPPRERTVSLVLDRTEAENALFLAFFLRSRTAITF